MARSGRCETSSVIANEASLAIDQCADSDKPAARQGNMRLLKTAAKGQIRSDCGQVDAVIWVLFFHRWRSFSLIGFRCGGAVFKHRLPRRESSCKSAAFEFRYFTWYQPAREDANHA